MSHTIPFTATFPDGSQLLIMRHIADDGTEYETAARRGASHETWGPPVRIELGPSEKDPPR